MTRLEIEVNALLIEHRRRQEENERKFLEEIHSICEKNLNEFAQEISVKRDPEKWLTVEELAEHFKVSKGTVYHWRDKGLIPDGVAFGARSTRWKLSEVEAYLKNNNPYQPQLLNQIVTLSAKKSNRGRKSRIQKLEALRYA